MDLIDMMKTFQMTNPGAHIDATDVYNSNDNLLDNAYFVGGGSQLGDGIFPINQKGQTSYGNGQTFDRWKLSAGGTVTLTQNGITFNGLLFQKKALDLVVGETYTLSRQTQTGEVVSLTGVVPSTEGWMIGSGAFGVYFRPSTKVCDIQIWGDYSLRAMKLEKGTVSTLANDVPPNFGEELRKCKRYLRYVPLTRTPAVIGGNTAVLTLNGIEMAGVPTPALISAGGARDAGGMQNITSATVTGFAYNTPTVQFALAGNLNYVIGYVYDTVVRLSCEL